MKVALNLFERLQSELDPIEKGMQSYCSNLYSNEKHSPYLIIIPAYNEAESIEYVAQQLPEFVMGERPEIIVIDDGSTDRTPDITRTLTTTSRKINCVSSPVNRGQGASLRTGYLAAIANNFSVVAIIDADGQWSPHDLEAVMKPVINGNADLCQGSRRLGETHVGDRFRDLGVTFFARLISIVTRSNVTDTSSGVRAISVGLLKNIRLTQPQYQSSELLIGALLQGGRLVEIPVVMESRYGGLSKKGRNLKYAIAYSKVVAYTTIRESSIHLLRLDKSKGANDHTT